MKSLKVTTVSLAILLSSLPAVSVRCNDGKPSKPFIVDVAENAVKALGADIAKETFNKLLLNPFFIKPLKKLFGIEKKKAQLERIENITKLASSIEALKKARASRSKIRELSEKLSSDLDEIIKEESDGKNKK